MRCLSRVIATRYGQTCISILVLVACIPCYACTRDMWWFIEDIDLCVFACPSSASSDLVLGGTAVPLALRCIPAALQTRALLDGVYAVLAGVALRYAVRLAAWHRGECEPLRRLPRFMSTDTHTLRLPAKTRVRLIQRPRDTIAQTNSFTYYGDYEHVATLVKWWRDVTRPRFAARVPGLGTWVGLCSFLDVFFATLAVLLCVREAQLARSEFTAISSYAAVVSCVRTRECSLCPSRWDAGMGTIAGVNASTTCAIVCHPSLRRSEGARTFVSLLAAAAIFGIVTRLWFWARVWRMSLLELHAHDIHWVAVVGNGVRGGGDARRRRAACSKWMSIAKHIENDDDGAHMGCFRDRMFRCLAFRTFFCGCGVVLVAFAGTVTALCSPPRVAYYSAGLCLQISVARAASRHRPRGTIMSLRISPPSQAICVTTCCGTRCTATCIPSSRTPSITT